MKSRLLLLIILPLLMSCTRKIPVTVYGNHGYPCDCTELVFNVNLHWEQGSYNGNIRFYGDNMRQTGYSVMMKEGTILTATASGRCYNEGADALCFTADDEVNDITVTLVEPIEIRGGVFSKPHYYIVTYENTVDYYYE